TVQWAEDHSTSVCSSASCEKTCYTWYEMYRILHNFVYIQFHTLTHTQRHTDLSHTQTHRCHYGCTIGVSGTNIIIASFISRSHCICQHTSLSFSRFLSLSLSLRG